MMLELDYLANHPELVQQVTELAHLEFNYLNPGRSIETRKQKVELHLNYNELPIAFVAFKNGKFAGTTSLREIDIESYTSVSPWLASVIIVPEMRSQGIGSWLVNETMNQAIKLGVDTWYLFTPNKESFYSRLGWKTIDMISYHNVPGVIMQKTFLSRL